MERRSFILGATALGLWPATARADEASVYEGRWKFVGGQAQRQKAYEAIDAGTESLNALFRSIARRMIRDTTHFPAFLTFTVGETDIKVDHQTAFILAPRNGKLVPWTNEKGMKVKARHKLVRGRLMQQIVDPRGDRINVFHVHEDGDRMTWYITVRAHQMPDDVNYRLSYRRV